MILADTSVWINHLRGSTTLLAPLLEAGRVLTHPFVIGEIALGQMRQRGMILAALSDMPRAETATEDEVLSFIERGGLFGRGIGYGDAHLLAAVRLSPGVALWTKDRRLNAVAHEVGLATHPRCER